MKKISEEELWIGFARDAMANYETPDVEDTEELVDHMAEVASDYADAMLDEFEERFGNTTGSSKKRRRSKSKRGDDDAEDD